MVVVELAFALVAFPIGERKNPRYHRRGIDRPECVCTTVIEPRKEARETRLAHASLLSSARQSLSPLSQVSCFLFAFHLSHCARASASGWTHVARQNAIGTRNSLSLSLSLSVLRSRGTKNRKRPRVDRRRREQDRHDAAKERTKKRKKKRERQPAEFSSWRMKVAFRGTRANRRRQIFDFHRGRERGHLPNSHVIRETHRRTRGTNSSRSSGIELSNEISLHCLLFLSLLRDTRDLINDFLLSLR